MRANSVFCTPCVFDKTTVRFNNPGKYLLILLVLFFTGGLKAQISPGSGLEFKVTLSKTDPKVGDTVEVIMTATLPEKNHLYSEKSDCPEEEGPIRADLRFDFESGVQLLDVVTGKGDTMIYDATWSCRTGEFDIKCEFRQLLIIKGAVNGLTCNFQGQLCSDEGICTQVDEKINVPLVVVVKE